ncbi:cell division protein FtsZ [Metabacillus halosaccharovorans]|uniref:cell division protein FtsZ n=1 Tax=Metabacillus halosaccharovorans TaxID=930124 RepID=UPI000C7F841B|nr:cell division protein FtsZ [Metabacillus halosaccharovorans]MBU7595900.1 cell division protein FtsZ [Metabacillus halosaccharovorans]PMC36250.1 cell division protein FtsZ [Bacillus sp. UMB0899]
MTKEEILDILKERLGDAIYILIVLKEGPLLKEQIKERANEYYKSKGNNNSDLIPSRHILDIYTARLEGAGLVNVREIGRARVYERSQLAEVLTNHIKLRPIK